MSGSTRALATLLAPLLLSCTTVYWRATLLAPGDAPEQPTADAPFLKVHVRDGSVLVLAPYTVAREARTISGTGIRYDAERMAVARGPLSIAFDDVALVETNRPETVDAPEVAVMALVTGASLAVTAACAMNPKACFGSCPTFYASGAEAAGPVAEGFSASVARAFEATDVDALELPHAAGAPVELVMRNEALETHYVRSVRLLAVPRPEGGRVYRAGDRFLASARAAPPSACRGAAGDCLAAVAKADGVEYLSPAGERDLAEQETIELAFPPLPGADRLGLVVRARNSLLNTFVFYQGLAWLGSRAGEVFARLERDPGPDAPDLPEWMGLLARIEVEVLTARGWTRAGASGEIGPLARETQIVPLEALRRDRGERGPPPGDVRVRLRLTRGNWRIDALALAEVAPAAEPVPVPVAHVLREGAPDDGARARLLDPAAYLVTRPGDAYLLRFEPPAALGDAELFLESRGYYLEWMRESWLAEEDLDAAMRLLAHPRDALRRLAPAYKRIEPEIEAIFWASRVARAP